MASGGPVIFGFREQVARMDSATQNMLLEHFVFDKIVVDRLRSPSLHCQWAGQPGRPGRAGQAGQAGPARPASQASQASKASSILFDSTLLYPIP